MYRFICVEMFHWTVPLNILPAWLLITRAISSALLIGPEFAFAHRSPNRSTPPRTMEVCGNSENAFAQGLLLLTVVVVRRGVSPINCFAFRAYVVFRLLKLPTFCWGDPCVLPKSGHGISSLFIHSTDKRAPTAHASPSCCLLMVGWPTKFLLHSGQAIARVIFVNCSTDHVHHLLLPVLLDESAGTNCRQAKLHAGSARWRFNEWVTVRSSFGRRRHGAKMSNC